MFDDEYFDNLFREEREKQKKELSRVLLLYEKAMEFIKDAKYKEACDALKEAVVPDIGGELYNWGTAYFNGLGVSQNNHKAKYWFEKAANKGDANALRALGLFYYYGIDTEKDFDKGLMYLKKAADQNNIDALEFLGSLYLNGEEVQKDEMQAFEYYRRASEKGSKLGSYNAAYICYYSDKPDKRKELRRYIDRLYRKDFDNEDFPKANFLAGVSNIRSYIPSDYKDAQRHFEAAIKKGDLDAQYVMGVLLYTGTRINQNKHEGMQLIKMAAENGLEEAIKLFASGEDRDIILKMAVKKILDE